MCKAVNSDGLVITTEQTRKDCKSDTGKESVFSCHRLTCNTWAGNSKHSTEIKTQQGCIL